MFRVRLTTMIVLPVLAGVAAMALVGGSVAVSSLLADAPLHTAQALRYALACLLLLGYTRLAGVRLVRPRGGEWWWLLGVTVAGLVVFNLALVHGAAHAEPAVLGVAVACVPLLLAVVGPLLEGRRPGARVLAAAVVVTAGAALVQGWGRADGTGLALAVVVFACEAAFTLLAVPVLRRHGPAGVSVHSTALAAVIFAAFAVVREGPDAALRLRLGEILAGAYLAVATTAVAFILWYTCVAWIGAARAGLLTGVAPVAAAASGVALGAPVPAPAVWFGIATVTAGLALGLWRGHTPSTADGPGPAGAGAGKRGPAGGAGPAASAGPADVEARCPPPPATPRRSGSSPASTTRTARR